jgi:hypothetical protein
MIFKHFQQKHAQEERGKSWLFMFRILNQVHFVMHLVSVLHQIAYVNHSDNSAA